MTVLDMPEDQIYCKSAVNGHMIKVTSIFESVIDANHYLEKNPKEGVIYQADNLVFCANIEDLGVKGMTLEMAKNLKQGQEIYHTSRKNADGTPMRCKVTSIKTWVTRPEEVLVKFKRGLYEYGTIDQTELDNITHIEPR